MVDGGLTSLIRFARVLVPLAVLLGVLIFEGLLRWGVPEALHFWLRLVFYGMLGPLTTFVVLNWIAQQAASRQEAQAALLEANRRMTLLGGLLRRALQDENPEASLQSVLRQLGQSVGGEVALLVDGFRVATPGFSPANPSVLQTLPGVEGHLEVQLGRPPTPGEVTFFEALSAEMAGTLGELRSRTRDLLTLVEVDQAVRAEANLERLLDNLLVRVVDWAGVSGGGVWLLDEEGYLQPQVLHNLDHAGLAFKPEGDWLVALEQPHFLAENRLALPLGGQTPVGLLLVEASRPVLEERLPFLRFVALQVSLAIRNAQAYLRAEELALNEERNRIAHEIHDGIAQALAFMALKLDLVDRLLTREPERARAELTTVKETLREQIREVRRSIFALRPIDLERYGFLESVRRYATAFAEQAGFRLRMELPAAVELSQASELVLFRVLQEALTNAIKHGRASAVQVHLEALERGAVLQITDNGRGFDSPISKNGLGGFGLAQMHERIAARGGRFTLGSEPGKGTTVRAELPY